MEYGHELFSLFQNCLWWRSWYTTILYCFKVFCCSRSKKKL